MKTRVASTKEFLTYKSIQFITTTAKTLTIDFEMHQKYGSSVSEYGSLLTPSITLVSMPCVFHESFEGVVVVVYKYDMMRKEGRKCRIMLLFFVDCEELRV